MTSIALTRLFKEFFASEKAGGFILLGGTVLSILLTNSGAGESWLHFCHAIEYGVNDGLMAVFFLLVGLEIERELYAGELADVKKALLPIVAAVGGMVVPACIHFLFNHGSATQHGFGIPMATDIAFALGVLSLLGNRVPVSLKIFLTALAIIDDLGAILVIAVFYTKTLSFAWLAFALAIFILLLVLNRLGVNRLIFYIIPGILLWYGMLRSGVHATLSGVLLAFAIPFRKEPVRNPSDVIQHALHKPVAFLIVPLFALVNTGILLSPGWAGSLGSSNSLGILSGLVLGKPLGIMVFSWLAIRTGLCRLPGDLRWVHVLGMGILAGVGFTMSIFISNLAFDHPETIQFSKIAILGASLLASILGIIVLYLASKVGTIFP
jgi:NhaA family Na+:H+ antiporter